MVPYESVDPHLNLFRRFGLPPGSQEYENNVTHAFINTLRVSDPRITRLILHDLVPEIRGVVVDWTDIGWGLQKPPRSPGAFENRVVLAISVDGRISGSAGTEAPQELPPQPNGEDEDGEPASPDEEGRGIPDAWIYTKQSDLLCILIEVKTRGGLSGEQFRRHELTHFAPRGTTTRRLDLTWRALSLALYNAYRAYPNMAVGELLAFLSLEGLAATLRFDDATIRLAGDRVPKDVIDEIANGLRSKLPLQPEQLIAWPDQQPLVLIFRSFEALGNIEIWLSGEPPEVSVKTRISLGTAQAQHGGNLLTMPIQIDCFLRNLKNSDVKKRSIAAIQAITPEPTWRVLARLQLVLSANFERRSAGEIAGLLRSAGREVDPGALCCFGEDNVIPGHDLDRVARGLQALHRAGPIQDGKFRGFRIYGYADLDELVIPAYGRSPEYLIPQVVEHCLRWHRVLRTCSGVE
jgi:hypothetical protein